MTNMTLMDLNEGDFFFFLSELMNENGPQVWEVWTDWNDQENDENEFHVVGHPEEQHHVRSGSEPVVRVQV